MRGSTPEYNQWGSLGNKGWNWDTLFPYFKKSESVFPGDLLLLGSNIPPGSTSSFGTSGPIQVSFINNKTFPSEILAPWGQAMNNVGSRVNDDPVSVLFLVFIELRFVQHSGNNTGTWITPRSVGGTGEGKGIRSSATLYLKSRKNLVILTNAQVGDSKTTTPIPA